MTTASMIVVIVCVTIVGLGIIFYASLLIGPLIYDALGQKEYKKLFKQWCKLFPQKEEDRITFNCGHREYIKLKEEYDSTVTRLSEIEQELQFLQSDNDYINCLLDEKESLIKDLNTTGCAICDLIAKGFNSINLYEQEWINFYRKNSKYYYASYQEGLNE